MTQQLIYLSDTLVRELLDWDKVMEAVETAMKSVTKDPRNYRSLRTVMGIPETRNALMLMPGYLNDPNYGGMSCKFLRIYPDNPKRRPSLSGNMATIAVFKEETGELEAIVEGTDITEWRTAAASAAATKHIYFSKSGRSKRVLAVLGAGAQGKSHVLAFQHYFQFDEVHVWNRTASRGQTLVDSLRADSTVYGTFTRYDRVEDAVIDADVIVAATTGSQTLIKLEHLRKRPVHINAIAVNPTGTLELEEAIYRTADIYVDDRQAADVQLSWIKNLGVEFKCQVGDVMVGTCRSSSDDKITIFQSLGMAVQDTASARMILNLYNDQKNIKVV